MKTVLLSLLLLATTLLAGNALAQHPNTAPIDTTHARNYSLYLNDGTALYGRIIRRDSSNYTVRLRSGQITYVPLDLLKNLGAGRPKTQDMVVVASASNPIIDTTNTPKNGYANRFGPYLLFNQTAFNPDAGRLYFRNQYGIINQLDFGITKFWSIGATAAPITWLLTDKNVVQNFVLQSKLTFPVGPWLRVGVGTTYRPAYTKNTNPNNHIAAAWQLEALASFGDSQRNITFAYGWQLSKAYNGTPAPTYLRIGAVVKLAPKVSFVSDNILAGRNQFAGTISSQFSGAIRLDRLRHSFDIGVLGLVENTFSSYYYCPYCSSYPSSGYSYSQRHVTLIPYVGYNLLLKSYRGRP